MKLHRYYPRGFQGKTYSEEYLEKLEKLGVDTFFVDNAKYSVKLTREEQEQMWQQSVDMVMKNTRFVLDNLDRLAEYTVNWQDYHKNAKIYRKARFNKNEKKNKK